MMSSACLPHIFKEDEMRIFVKSKNTIVSGKGLFNWILEIRGDFLFLRWSRIGSLFFESVQLSKFLKMSHFSSILNKTKSHPSRIIFYSIGDKDHFQIPVEFSYPNRILKTRKITQDWKSTIGLDNIYQISTDCFWWDGALFLQLNQNVSTQCQ